MNMRQRMLAVIRGEGPDRVPFVQYSGIAAPDAEVRAVIGEDNLGALRWCNAFRIEYPNCRVRHEDIEVSGDTVRRNTIETPAGCLYEDRPFVPAMGGVAGFSKHYVTELDDYRVLVAFLKDAVVIDDDSAVRRVIDDLGEGGLPHTSLGRTPFQRMWIEWTSIEDLSIHLVDDPDLVEEAMVLIGDIVIRCAQASLRAAREIEIPYIVIPDNLTAPMIGESRFRRYCLPCYRQISDMFAEEGIPVFVHMDGDLKALWNAIGESGVRGIDSLSPPPDNDTSVADARRNWPEMRLCVNFPSSVHLADAQRVYDTARDIILQDGKSGMLQIQVSENVPPGAWTTSYPAIARAISDFGALV